MICSELKKSLIKDAFVEFDDMSFRIGLREWQLFAD